ncbi:MAG: hypothetical protein KF891_05650 [Rhizobacter sp.]|nr:hypothetical protein [Rhizobacter sp.]
MPDAPHDTLHDTSHDASHDRPALQRRLLRPADFAEALQLLPPWLALGEAERARLPALWARLLHHPGFNADAIEDVAAPVGQRLQALGMSIALDDTWQRRLRGTPAPWVTQQLYTELLDGRSQPPGEREMARANASTDASGGVSFMVLHYQQRDRDMAHPRAVAVLSAGVTAMRLAHGGHRVREVFQEAWQSERDYMASVGMVQRSAHNRPPEAQALPELFSLTRDEALRKLPGFQLREIFEHTPPLFHFRGAEQRLLRRALFDESDDDIAALLGVSMHTIKKLWRAIYARVDERFAALLAEPGAPVGDGVRGPEKRRLLLRYLRQHLEELRPHAAAARAVPSHARSPNAPRRDPRA